MQLAVSTMEPTMVVDPVEVECPVCDKKVRADAARCPHCGAEFSMSGVDELEKVVQDLSRPAEPPSSEVAPVPIVEEAHPVPPASAVASTPEPALVTEQVHEDDKGGKGLFGKLFKKKK
jgi:hypothetical protein